MPRWQIVTNYFPVKMNKSNDFEILVSQRDRSLMFNIVSRNLLIKHRPWPRNIVSHNLWPWHPWFSGISWVWIAVEGRPPKMHVFNLGDVHRLLVFADPSAAIYDHIRCFLGMIFFEDYISVTIKTADFLSYEFCHVFLQPSPPKKPIVMAIRLFQLPRRFCWRRISREIYKNVSRFKSLTESEKFPYLSGNLRRIQDLKLKSDEIWIFCGKMTDWWLKLWSQLRKI